MKWDNTNTGGPAPIEETDFQDIIKSDCMWTRKIENSEVAKKLLKLLMS